MYWCISLTWICCRLRTEASRACASSKPGWDQSWAMNSGIHPPLGHDSYWKCYLRYTDCWSNLGLSSSLLRSSSWWNLSFVFQRCFLFCDQVMPRFWLLSRDCELCLSVQSGCSAFVSDHSPAGRQNPFPSPCLGGLRRTHHLPWPTAACLPGLASTCRRFLPP